MKKYILMLSWVVMSLVTGFGQSNIAHEGEIYTDDLTTEIGFLTQSQITDIQNKLIEFKNSCGLKINIIYFSQDCFLSQQDGKIFGPEVNGSCIWLDSQVDYLFVFEPGVLTTYKKGYKNSNAEYLPHESFTDDFDAFNRGDISSQDKPFYSLHKIVNLVAEKYSCTPLASFTPTIVEVAPYLNKDFPSIKGINNPIMSSAGRVNSNFNTKVGLGFYSRLINAEIFRDEGGAESEEAIGLKTKFGNDFILFRPVISKNNTSVYERVDVIPLTSTDPNNDNAYINALSPNELQQVEVAMGINLSVADESQFLTSGFEKLEDLFRNNYGSKVKGQDCPECNTSNALWDPNEFTRCVDLPSHLSGLLEISEEIDQSNHDSFHDYAGLPSEFKQQILEAITRGETKWNYTSGFIFSFHKDSPTPKSTFTNAQNKFNDYTIFVGAKLTNGKDQVVWLHFDKKNNRVCFKIMVGNPVAPTHNEYSQFPLEDHRINHEDAAISFFSKPKEDFYSDGFSSISGPPSQNNNQPSYFGIRNGWEDKANFFSMLTEAGGILKQTVSNPADPRLPEEVWKYDGDCLFDGPGLVIGLADGILAENPISGVYGLGSMAYSFSTDKETRTQIISACLSPLETGKKVFNSTREGLTAPTPEEEIQYNGAKLGVEMVSMLWGGASALFNKIKSSKAVKNAGDEVSDAVNKISDDLKDQLDKVCKLAGKPGGRLLLKKDCETTEEFMREVEKMGPDDVLPSFNRKPNIVFSFDVIKGPFFDGLSKVRKKANLEQLADYITSLGKAEGELKATIDKLKSSFANASDEFKQKWIDLKISKQELESLVPAIHDNKALESWTKEHKAARWDNKKASGSNPEFESWSNTYDGNAKKSVKGKERSEKYAADNGIQIPPSEVERLIPKNITVRWIRNGQTKTTTGKRRIDVYDLNERKAIEIKDYSSQNVSLSEKIEIEVRMDIALLNDPTNNIDKIEWIFVGKDALGNPNGPSANLRKLLEDNNIQIIVK